MRNTNLITAGALVAVLAGGMAARPAFAQDREQDERKESAQSKAWPPTKPAAKVTPLQAMEAARGKLGGGTPFNSNLEFDEGHWVYGVMVVKGHAISEVEVDPMTGKALDSESVSPADEAKETQEELTKIAAAGG